MAIVNKIIKSTMCTEKKKTCYWVIIEIRTGRMLLEDGKLPFYWNGPQAKKRAKLFPGFIAKKINADKLNGLVAS